MEIRDLWISEVARTPNHDMHLPEQIAGSQDYFLVHLGIVQEKNNIPLKESITHDTC